MAGTPAPAPTAVEGDPPINPEFSGLTVDSLSSMAWLLFPFVFFLACFILRQLWGCCARCCGWGNRGRPPKKKDKTDKVLETVAAPFDFVIDGLSGRGERTRAEGGDASVDDLLKDLGGSPWVEQWDETHQAWYFWNTKTNEVTRV